MSNELSDATGWTLVTLAVFAIVLITYGLYHRNWMLWATGALCAWLFIKLLE